MKKYVAFLRGINVGGHKKVPMAELKKVFEKIGFKNVKTLLISGNVVFEGDEDLLNKIPDALEKKFGFIIEIIFLPFQIIKEIVESNPLKKIKVTPDIRLYVTFFKEKPKKKLTAPFISKDNSFQIIKITDIAAFSFLDLSKTGTPESMGILEKEFGKNITTRNYNTVEKLAKL